MFHPEQDVSTKIPPITDTLGKMKLSSLSYALPLFSLQKYFIKELLVDESGYFNSLPSILASSNIASWRSMTLASQYYDIHITFRFNYRRQRPNYGG